MVLNDLVTTVVGTLVGGLIAAAVALVGTRVQDRRRRAEQLADRRAAVAGHALGLICRLTAACRRQKPNLVVHRLLDDGPLLDTAIDAFADTLDADAARRLRELGSGLTCPENYANGQPGTAQVAARLAALRTELRRLAPGVVPILPPDRDPGGLA